MTPDAERRADDVLRAAWCRGAAFLLFEIEEAHPPGHFGSAGLGLIAAQLLDHAWCIEHHSRARPVVESSDDVPPSGRAR